ncbi:Gfo/Idh/MocA family oxidoreductase [Halobacillus litoralis]|uniref:Gfo/Idh/MocA family protein n=1 Tax=Halobacillus litoralis TaxID=45668 RepID=UPI001CD21E9B|nr:Gfo/Idh/MocA family oxidoreductase [Halobacillus litoralis]MCA0970640.1 Gfo/Idh/MocA family oxidoreductase [Halobacillus litoralis]
MIKFGIIGTNWITERFLDAVKDLEGFSLSAVYSRTEEKAASFASKFGAEHTFTDLEQMAQSDFVDAVYIASPNALHCEQAILMMNHGKHVLCEKPLASNTRETKAMIEASEKNNVLLMEAMKSTLSPNFKILQENLHKIGKVRRYHANFSKYSSRYDAYREGTVLNAFNPQFSNGSLMDLGVYCIYPMVVLFGEPNSIQASGIVLDSGVDGSGSILAQYEDMEGIMTHGKTQNSSLHSEIQGEEGSIIIDGISTLTHLEVRYRDGASEVISTVPEHAEMYYEAEEFIKLIQEGKTMSSVNSFEHSLATAEILEAARKQIGVVYPADHS